MLIEALGDYSPVPPGGERIDIDGIFTDFAFDPSRGATLVDVDGSDPLFQIEAMQSYTVSGAGLFSITGDGTVSITLQNSFTIGFFADQPEDFVRTTMTYNAVPEPSSCGIVALLSLTCILGRRRK